MLRVQLVSLVLLLLKVRVMLLVPMLLVRVLLVLLMPELQVVLVFLLLLLLLLLGPSFEEGIKMCFFPLVWRTPSSCGLPPSSPPGYFQAGLDPGPGPPLPCWWRWWWPPLYLLLLLLTWLTSFLCFQVAGGKTWRYGQFVYTPSTWGVFLPPSQSSADPRILMSPGWLWSHPLSGTAGRHSPSRLSRPGIWGGWNPQPGHRHLNMPPGPPQ